MFPYFNTLSETIKRVLAFILLKSKIQRPLVLLVHARWEQGKGLGSAESKLTKANVCLAV